LAEHAIKVVENGEITIVPENFKQMYLNWMYNIHDWCISRQLWWGHRIPAWHCQDCSEIIVAREEPLAMQLRRQAGTGPGCARHLVLVGIFAVHGAGLAGEDARSGSFLSRRRCSSRLTKSCFCGFRE
jgi:valyl-tRNA synthetase